MCVCVGVGEVCDTDAMPCYAVRCQLRALYCLRTHAIAAFVATRNSEFFSDENLRPAWEDNDTVFNCPRCLVEFGIFKRKVRGGCCLAETEVRD